MVISYKSETCFKKNGEPLVSYSSEYEAKEGATYVKMKYGSEQEPYHCSKCGEWHLSPKEHHTPSRMCSCKDANGNPKQLYETKEAAERRAQIIEAERGIRLTTYMCHYQNGYHLTSNGW